MKTNKPTLTIMVGNVASGKSTWIGGQLKSAPSSGLRPLIVSKDAIRRMLSGGQYHHIQSREWLVHRIALETIEWIMANSEARPHQNNNIIYDETNEDREVRKYFIYLAKMYGYAVTAQVMPVISLIETLKRRCGDADEAWGIPKAVWTNIYRRRALDYEPPSLDEGFDAIHYEQ